ncbi:MAG: right-handed parallel beta-helix repeat-containing protein [Planctomycetaceae bacterium]|nr:right-handed parallel beta-helix repeat-containing protein [Planctomycetaceae bacterium]
MFRFSKLIRNSRQVLARRKICTWLLAALMVACGTTAPAIGDVWYVDNENGQDTNSGRTQEIGAQAAGPFRTINRALAAAKLGDTIVLAKNESPYREVITFAGSDNSGFPGQPFRLIGNGAVLSGTQEILPGQWQSIGDGIYECRPADGAFQQLYLGARPASFQSLTQGTLSELQPLGWTLIDGRLYFRTEDGMLPNMYDLHYAAAQTGITLYLVRHVSIENLTIQGFWQDGINAHDNVRDTKVVGVTVRGNGRSGISVGGSSRLDVVSSLIGDNWHNQVRAEGVSHVRLLGSNVLANGHGEAKYQLDQGQITEEVPVVNAPIERRLQAVPVRQASPGSVLEPSATPTRSSRLFYDDAIYR